MNQSDQRRWALALEVDGKPVTITGREIILRGWSMVDANADGTTVAAGDLVQYGEAVKGIAASDSGAGRPKPGDLHEWDALVDGCLYIDRGAADDAPYYYQLDGLGDWIYRNGSPQACPTPVGAGWRSPRPEVLAYLGPDAPLAAFCDAAREHARGGAR